jgi:hypothetical protein
MGMIRGHQPRRSELDGCYALHSILLGLTAAWSIQLKVQWTSSGAILRTELSYDQSTSSILYARSSSRG